MDDWRTGTLRDVAAPRGLVGGPFGSSLGGKDYVPSGVPVIRGVNLGSGGYFDPAEFVRGVDNPLFPLPLGRRLIYQASD